MPGDVKYFEKLPEAAKGKRLILLGQQANLKAVGYDRVKEFLPKEVTSEVSFDFCFWGMNRFRGFSDSLGLFFVFLMTLLSFFNKKCT